MELFTRARAGKSVVPPALLHAPCPRKARLAPAATSPMLSMRWRAAAMMPLATLLGMRLKQLSVWSRRSSNAKGWKRNEKSAAFAVALAPLYTTTTRMAPLMTFNAVPAKELASPLSSGIFAVNALSAHNCTLCCWAQEHETAFVPALRNFTSIGVKSSMFRPPLPLEALFSPLAAFLTRPMSHLRASLLCRNKSWKF